MVADEEKIELVSFTGAPCPVCDGKGETGLVRFYEGYRDEDGQMVLVRFLYERCTSCTFTSGKLPEKYMKEGDGDEKKEKGLD